MKKIALFGSTGSIGRQTLSVIDMFPEDFQVTVLVANNNVELLADQTRKYKPKYVVLVNVEKKKYLLQRIGDMTKIKILYGAKGVEEVAKDIDNYDLMLAAIVGMSGLSSVFIAAKHGKKIALANKESLIVLGHEFAKYLKKDPNLFIPVDSEHSAIFQCLQGEDKKNIDNVILTASGGPFRGKKKNLLQHVMVQNALDHPNWKMGEKITIDSATLMNKGLEMIEAKWLFGLENHQINVIVHPESIVHSMVEFIDQSIKAQFSLPNMMISIQYALFYPKRRKSNHQTINFGKILALNFEEPDYKTFECLDLAKQAMEKGGNCPCMLNSANEMAVHLFLNKKINFLQIPHIIEKTLHSFSYSPEPSYDEIIDLDLEIKRKIASMYL